MKKFLLLCLLTLQALALDVEDIAIMRDMGVLIAFPSEQKAHPIPSSMRPRDMMRVNYLNFNGKALYFLPPWLPKMTNISRLELKNTKITLKELQKLRPLTELDILDISGNPLFKDGGNLAELLSTFSLTQLNLSNTGGSSSNYANIGSLSSLIKLDLSGNAISDIATLRLQKLPNLRELSLSGNQIGGRLNTNSLPKDSLRELYLSGNSISKFAFSGDFPALRVLDISNNRQYLAFDEEYSNPYMFKKLKQGKFNSDVALPQSIMTRLGIKSKWIDVDASSCRANGGEMNNGVCEAPWKEAKKICSVSGGRLPTIEELEKVVSGCGGINVKYKDSQWYEINYKNIANSSYQSCYKAKGFISSYYWSSTTNASALSYAWNVGFNNDYTYNKHKYSSLYVRCVRAGQ